MSKREMVKNFNDSAPKIEMIRSMTELQRSVDLLTARLDSLHSSHQGPELTGGLLEAVEVISHQMTAVSLLVREVSTETGSLREQVQRLSSANQQTKRIMTETHQLLVHSFESTKRLLALAEEHEKTWARLQIALPKPIQGEHGRSHQPRLPTEAQMTEVLSIMSGSPGKSWIERLKG